MSTTLLEIKPTQIAPHPRNPRHDLDGVDVSDITATIADHGIVEPLIVAPDVSAKSGAAAKYILIAGHRRWKAAKSAKCKTVPCILREDLTDPAKQLETALIENFSRVDLSPIEEAEAYQQLLEFPDYTQKRIVQATGRSASTVRARLKLIKLPDSTREKIHRGQISLADADALGEFAGNASWSKRLEKAIGTASFAYELQQARNERENTQRGNKARKELVDAGVRVLTVRPGHASHLYGREAIDEHRDCPGFAAYIGFGGAVQYVCDQPELHKPVDDSPTLPSVFDRVSEEERERQQRELADATKTRRKHVKQWMTRPLNPSVAATLLAEALLAQIAYEGEGVEQLLELLGIAPAEETDDESIDIYEAHARQLAAALRDLNLDQLVVCWDYFRFLNAEEQLARIHGWRPGHYMAGETAAWRERLVTVYGYEWSPVELELMPAAATDAEPADS